MSCAGPGLCCACHKSAALPFKLELRTPAGDALHEACSPGCYGLVISSVALIAESALALEMMHSILLGESAGKSQAPAPPDWLSKMGIKT